MITRIEYNGVSYTDFDDLPPLGLGETAVLAAWGDGDLVVQIRCLKSYPPPVTYAPCPQCGAYVRNSGEPFRIEAPIEAFGTGGAAYSTGDHYLVVDITDSRGSHVVLQFTVRLPAYSGIKADK